MKARQGRTPSVEQAVADRSISFIRSEFAIRNTDGSGTVLRQGEPLITAWHLKILSAFIAFALLLVPVAWLVARRLGAPMRKLAGWVERADLGDEGQGPPLGGPRELRQVARAIGEMRERLRSHVEERTVMLAAVAHDLRTPLTALRLRSEEARQPTREKMVADIGRLEQMIAQFLSFVRGAGAAAEVGEVDLGEIVSAAAASAAEAGRPVSHGALPSLKARGSAVDLRRVVENLVDNAVRFGGSAELSLEEGDGFAVLKVMDRGPGLPEQELERVFEPFYRPDASRSSETGGTGLGLAIVLAIVRAHGGEASLRNRAGGGIEAEVRLPKASASGCATGGGGKKDLRNGHLIR